MKKEAKTQMQKIFYVSRQTEDTADGQTSHAPDMDRFQRIDKLNELIARGWSIKEFKEEEESSYFVLEKAD